MFTEVENRFDQVDFQFSQLRREVHFVSTQVAFNAIESNFNAVQYQFLTLSHASSNASYMYQSHEYISTYDRTYSSDGVRLFNSIVHDGLVSGGLFSEFMKYSNYDHKATQRFMLGTLNLLMRALISAGNGLCRADAKSRHSLSESGLGTPLFEGQGENDGNWSWNNHPLPQHAVQDVNDFSTAHPKGGLSNADFAAQLYKILTDKVNYKIQINPNHSKANAS